MTFDEWMATTMLPAEVDDYLIKHALRVCWDAALHEAIKIADSHCSEYTSDEADNSAYADGYTDAAAFIWQDITKIVGNNEPAERQKV